MKYYLIAGEASGDLHGSNLIKAISQLDADADFRAWGGDLMQQSGALLMKHFRDLAFMGFYEVLKNIRTILGNFKFCKEDIEKYEPDVLILIDYPGFNLRMAKWAKERGIKVVYYISPQIWAWHKSRVHSIKRDVDKMLVILPFEKQFYEKYGMEVSFVGHPLLDALGQIKKEADFLAKNELDHRPIIALLPGSRRQEINNMLPTMLATIQHFSPHYQFVLAAAPSLPVALYADMVAALPVRIVQGQTYQVLQHATAALVTSGTATLETALFNVPQVVCYKGNFISYFIAKRLVDIKYIALVNLILDKPLVKELIQGDFNEKNVQTELKQILELSHEMVIKQGYDTLREMLGKEGASARAAREIVAFIAKSRN